MRKKQLNTLKAIFDKPTRANIKWKEIELLIESLGGQVLQGEGSRVRFLLNGSVARFHRPHPSPDTDKGAVVSLREWLISIGVTPNEK
ncbi:hexulose-6-phosphate synthase [Haemophilus paracuniculus]|uniref:Hexulose-6-phosphate synthase n=1 Tax=Haemophilus paracuniculus TaxID=734 RepID=A0A1T0AVJ2_9PAST|nr:type II toxin-antitoxin system HicA family toxin [Haemophilus paracuniculus]OOS00904.1 hexulose-6-phosphate synthase [Haemophilus paracuniculus]